MTAQFTTKDIIEMASQLYREEGLSSEEVRLLLETWRDNEMWNVSDAKLEKVFHMIVG